MIKLACSTGVRSTESLDVACAMIADMGFRYVDPLAMSQWHIKPATLVADAAAEAVNVRGVFERYGLACPAINLGFVYGFTTATDEEHLVNLKVLEGACVLAKKLDTTILTVSPGGMGDDDRTVILDRVSARLNEALAIGAREGMTLALETHSGAIAVHPAAVRELLERCPGLTLTYDPSHYIAEEIPVEETLDLLNHTTHVHLRNARVGHFQERMDRGGLDMPWMIDRILAAGYDGTISIEYIQDCGGLQEGYEVRDEAELLKRLLLDKGLTLE